MEPRGDLVDKGYCLAKEGEEYVIYLPEADAVTLDVQGAASRLAARWYNPRGGEKVELDGEITDGTHKFQPPADFGRGDVVLHVRPAM